MRRRRPHHRPCDPSSRLGREPAVAASDREQIRTYRKGGVYDAIRHNGAIEAVNTWENLGLGFGTSLMKMLRRAAASEPHEARRGSRVMR